MAVGDDAPLSSSLLLMAMRNEILRRRVRTLELRRRARAGGWKRPCRLHRRRLSRDGARARRPRSSGSSSTGARSGGASPTSKRAASGGARRAGETSMTATARQGPAPAAAAGLSSLPLGFFLALALIFLLRLESGADPDAIPSALVGKPAPEFDLPPLDGARRARPEARRPRRQGDASSTSSRRGAGRAGWSIRC